jgi:cytochrome P450
MAGADSTSIALRAVFYYLLKDPKRLRKARDEIDAAFESGTLSHPVQNNSAIKLPYLSAVVKESGRLFPSFQVCMPRHAPAEGLELCGKHIPAGYCVGMNPAIIGHDKGVFGEDAGEFNPERWLDLSDDRLRVMDRAMIGFGAGTRTCVGKPVRNALHQFYCMNRILIVNSLLMPRSSRRCLRFCADLIMR